MRSASVSGSAALLAPFQGFQRVEMPSHTFRAPRQLPGLPRGLAVRDGGVFLSSLWAASRRHGRRGRRQRRIRRVPVAAAVDAARDVVPRPASKSPMIRGASRDVVAARAATPRPRAQALADERRGIDPHRRAHVVEGVLRAADDVVHVRGARRDIVAARGGARTARARAPMCRPKIHDYVRFEIYSARRTRRRACPRGYSLVRAASVQSSPREAR